MSCQVTPDPAPLGTVVQIALDNPLPEVPRIDGLSWLMATGRSYDGVVLKNGPIDLSALGCPDLGVIPPFDITAAELPPARPNLGPLPYWQYSRWNWLFLLFGVAIVTLLLIKRIKRPVKQEYPLTSEDIYNKLLAFSFSERPAAKAGFVEFFALYRLYLAKIVRLGDTQPSVGQLLAVYNDEAVAALLKRGEFLEYGPADLPPGEYLQLIEEIKQLLQSSYSQNSAGCSH